MRKKPPQQGSLKTLFTKIPNVRYCKTPPRFAKGSLKRFQPPDTKNSHIGRILQTHCARPIRFPCFQAACAHPATDGASKARRCRHANP
jgi:hypothetical protein